MKRGGLYRVTNPTAECPKNSRVFVIVSRPVLIGSRFSTVVCAPIFSTHDALSAQVWVGANEGLKHNNSIHCDELVSLPQSVLTNLIGSPSPQKIRALHRALSIALDILKN